MKSAQQLPRRGEALYDLGQSPGGSGGRGLRAAAGAGGGGLRAAAGAARRGLRGPGAQQAGTAIQQGAQQVGAAARQAAEVAARLAREAWDAQLKVLEQGLQSAEQIAAIVGKWTAEQVRESINYFLRQLNIDPVKFWEVVGQFGDAIDKLLGQVCLPKMPSRQPKGLIVGTSMRRFNVIFRIGILLKEIVSAPFPPVLS